MCFPICPLFGEIEWHWTHQKPHLGLSDVPKLIWNSSERVSTDWFVDKDNCAGKDEVLVQSNQIFYY